jgi:PAS domain S-box-containing protein
VNLPALLSGVILSPRSDAFIAADREGIIRFLNPGAERIFGHTVDDAVGRSLDLIIPERLRQRHWGGISAGPGNRQEPLRWGEVLSVPAVCNDGKTISIELRSSR